MTYKNSSWWTFFWSFLSIWGLRISLWIGLAGIDLGAVQIIPSVMISLPSINQGYSRPTRTRNASNRFQLPHCQNVSLIGGDIMGRTDRVKIHFRVLQEEDLPLTQTQPRKDLSVSEWGYARIEMRINQKSVYVFQADEEGWVSKILSTHDLHLSAGDHTVQWLSIGDRSHRTLPCLIQTNQLRLFLPSAQEAVVIRSDLDLTYLDTPLGNRLALFKLLGQAGPKRAVLPKRTPLYKLLRQGQSAQREFKRFGRPLLWISGSPIFFYRSLAAKLKSEGLTYEGLILKPFKQMTYTALTSFKLHKLNSLVRAQIPYKLRHLLEQRRFLPNRFKELLLGDSSESDALIYDLYAGILEGKITPTDLESHLRHLKVDSSQIPMLLQLTQDLIHTRSPRKYHSGIAGILIHQVQSSPHHSKIKSSLSLAKASQRYSSASLIQGSFIDWIEILKRWKILTTSEVDSLR